jgi:hypothetical protein
MSDLSQVDFELVTNGVQSSSDLPNITASTWAISFDPNLCDPADNGATPPRGARLAKAGLCLALHAIGRPMRRLTLIV